jgi:hypothetical protein
LRVIDRLFQYIETKSVLPTAFERNCGIANGYLKKQARGRGSIGSEILLKIIIKYSDLSLIWLVTGNGSMNNDLAYGFSAHNEQDHRIKDEKVVYITDERTVRLLHEKIIILENALADKEKIIRLIEGQINKG